MSVELVEVLRSGFRECVHRGSVAVVAPDGEIVVALGEVHTPIYPRSCNKPMQVLALLRHGYAPFDDAELALATASHFGEPRHVAVVIRLLERIGCTEADLACPPEMPLDERSRALLLAADEPPRRIYMNCSGKHAAMLATCVHNGWPLAGYHEPAHPLQQAVTATVVDITGEPETELGIDGCGLPIVPVSLVNLARAFATLATAPAGTPERRLVDAALADPYLIGGTGGEDPTLMAAMPGLFSKVGADGVHAGAMPDGTAFALKIDDGSDRARVPLVAALLSSLGVDASDALLDLATAPVLGGGARVGAVRALPGLFAQR